MKCKCGNDQFYAGQKCFHTVIVDQMGYFVENVSVDDSDEPYGPFECTKCGIEYEELD